MAEKPCFEFPVLRKNIQGEARPHSIAYSKDARDFFLRGYSGLGM
jgi:hypothetical protein